MAWRALSTAMLLTVLGACSIRSPVPRAEARVRAASPPAPVAEDPAVDAGALPCPSLKARHARALADADRSCKSQRDRVCVDLPPFQDVQVVVGRTAAPGLVAIAAAIRAQGCPPISVAQRTTRCMPTCRRGQCVAR
jgi:hypothetical protein